MALNSLMVKKVSVANTEVTVYTVPSNKQFSNVSVNLVNTGSSPATIKMGVTTGSSLSAVDYLEYGATLSENGGRLRRTNILMSPNEKLIVKASTDTVGIRAFGLEQV